MKTFFLKRELQIPVPLNEAWSFFSNPHNLARITPEEMDFKIVSKHTPEIVYKGLTIEYSVKPLFGIKTTWASKISDIDAPYTFSDEQIKGPYSKWLHKHTFAAHPNGTLMTDEVEYALPFSFLEDFIHENIVRKKLNQIFDFRAKAILNLFALSKSSAA